MVSHFQILFPIQRIQIPAIIILFIKSTVPYVNIVCLLSTAIRINLKCLLGCLHHLVITGLERHTQHCSGDIRWMIRQFHIHRVVARCCSLCMRDLSNHWKLFIRPCEYRTQLLCLEWANTSEKGSNRVLPICYSSRSGTCAYRKGICGMGCN